MANDEALANMERLAKEALDAIEKAKERLGARPQAPRLDSCVEQARQRVTAWLNAHHTPSRTDLEALRAALHAGVLETTQIDSIAGVGMSLAGRCRDTLASIPSTGSRGTELLGLLVKYLATSTEQTSQGQRMRRIALEVLQSFPPKGRGGPRFTSKKKGAVN